MKEKGKVSSNYLNWNKFSIQLYSTWISYKHNKYVVRSKQIYLRKIDQFAIFKKYNTVILILIYKDKYFCLATLYVFLTGLVEDRLGHCKVLKRYKFKETRCYLVTTIIKSH